MSFHFSSDKNGVIRRNDILIDFFAESSVDVESL